MPKETKYYINVEIDRLTNSVQNTISGDSFPTDVHPISKADLKSINKKNKWLFNWSQEFKMTDRNVFKLTIKNNPDIIQGLVSISDYTDHFYLHLIESAPFNLGRHKLYEGVPGNLFAFTAKSLGIKDIKDLFPLPQNQSKLTIMKGPSERHILAQIRW
jgi:hypothetical protein